MIDNGTARADSESDVVHGSIPGAADRDLLAHIEMLQRAQLEVLDTAGKSIVEISSALLGLLFATLAFGRQFPAPYLGSALMRWLIVAVLLFLLGAILLGLRTLQPRSYTLYRQNLTALWQEIDRIAANKSFSLRLAGLLFFGGVAALAALIGSIVFG